MEVKLWVSVMSVTCSWIFCTGLSAPAAETSTAAPLRHVRNKRCSCATFLDRECVYFCHLDIIWVNTPERVVSYGLGNAPRARRALTDSMATSRGGLRCRCVRETDRTCENFCLRLETAADPQRTGGTGGTDRTQVTNNPPPPPPLQAAIRTRTLLGKWMKARRRHRTRAWRAESTAS
ncbi:endothelin-1 [Kryptolebias marmoratus]|uniref:endothelin-1 n=1 Tax=Kryptolebias marmoratus TaxID=37003 RepID=UPI0018ACDA1E|nr:endothelin-1 [Kryptolebias marmoratus]